VLSKELMEVHEELGIEILRVEDGAKVLVNDMNDMTVAMNTEVKKQFGEMYDKLDVLYKDLENISNTIDTAKETFLGKYIIK
jgi:citrate lyase gamma subunit